MPAVQFVEGDPNAVHAALALAGAPVGVGVNAAGSRANFQAYILAGAVAVGNMPHNRTVGVNSITFNNMSLPDSYRVCREWRSAPWIQSIRAQRAAAVAPGGGGGVPIGNIGQVFILHGGGNRVSSFLEPGIFD